MYRDIMVEYVRSSFYAESNIQTFTACALCGEAWIYFMHRAYSERCCMCNTLSTYHSNALRHIETSEKIEIFTKYKDFY